MPTIGQLDSFCLRKWVVSTENLPEADSSHPALRYVRDGSWKMTGKVQNG